jgi:alpha-L-fucosidase
MDWFNNAKFGIFIHWGLYSVPAYDDIECAKRRRIGNGSEWYLNRLNKTFRVGKSDTLTKEYHQKHYDDMSYSNFKTMFTGKYFNTDEWCKLFKRVGAKYIVFTAKHHDGFCLWDTKTTTNNVMNTPMKLDVLLELSKSAKKYGLKLGIYYSWMEFEHGISNKYINNIVKPQLDELLGYEPDLFWFDGDWSVTAEKLQSDKFVNKIHKLGIIVNSRLGKDSKKGDYENFSDRFIPDTKQKNKFECCYTIGYSWGFNRQQTKEDLKSVDELYDVYKKVTRRNGNLLLNISPDRHGSLNDIEEQILIKLGKKITKN